MLIGVEQLFWAVIIVRSGLAVIPIRRRDPFGAVVGKFLCPPAISILLMVGLTGKGEFVGIG
ncbi:hypothetical protein [Mycobacterium lepromatosis]|uniref:hypothetical protein n=1 Tax=Mycobacterium lepromatosis TaxID=480418 RepID=UPI000A5C07A8